MKTRLPERDKYLLGSVLFLALVIGGGTTGGLYTDSIVMVAAILGAAFVLSRPSSQMLDRRVVALSIAALLVMAVQLVPLPASWLAALRPEVLRGEGEAWRFGFITLGVGRTVESLLFVVAFIAFLLALMRLRPEQLHALLPFFFMGAICNMIAGAIQYSLASTVAVETFLPYTITGGLFANANHFSALLFVSIPFIIYHTLARGNWLGGALGLLAVLLILLAAGSRAGMLIGLATSVMSLVFLVARTGVSRVAVPGLFLLASGCAVAMGAWTRLDQGFTDPTHGRGEIAATTMAGISENWVIGTGFGSFQNAYQIYERREMIFQEYVNHAHNDYLEIVFEGGVLAAGLIAIYILLLLARSFEVRLARFQKAALLAIGFLLVHSMVDYPLRTFALALSFAFFNAILFHGGLDAKPSGPEPRPAKPIEPGRRLARLAHIPMSRAATAGSSRPAD